jgi:hypothetical protein
VRYVPDGAGEKYEKRGRSSQKWVISVFLLPQSSKIFVYQPTSSKFYTTVALILSAIMIVKQPGKGVKQPINLYF